MRHGGLSNLTGNSRFDVAGPATPTTSNRILGRSVPVQSWWEDSTDQAPFIMNTNGGPARRFGLDCLALGFVLGAWPAIAMGADRDVVQPCKIPDNPFGYVRGSLNLLEAGKPRTTILDTLACIAKSRDVHRGGEGALNAIMHLAENDEQIREYFLRVLEDPKTDLTVRWEVCERLVFVADGRVRKFLLEEYEREWAVAPTPSTILASNYSRALVTLGDTGFLKALEEVMESLGPGDPTHRLLTAWADRVRVQRDLQSMLDAIRSDNPPTDRGWIIRQARRHGASKTQLQTAVREYVLRCRSRQEKIANQSSLERACKLLSLFTEEEATAIGLPGASANPDIKPYSQFYPSWATGYREKWAQFWGVDRIESE